MTFSLKRWILCHVRCVVVDLWLWTNKTIWLHTVLLCVNRMVHKVTNWSSDSLALRCEMLSYSSFSEVLSPDCNASVSHVKAAHLYIVMQWYLEYCQSEI